MIRLAALISVLASSCFAQTPLFQSKSDALPGTYSYDGGWEHFVGGGVAVFDCNNDALPDIFVAGGEGDAALFVNKTTPEKWGFLDGNFPKLTGVTGAYPIDYNNDELIDLFVLRVGTNRLFQGLGDCQFEDVNQSVGLRDNEYWSTSFSATWEKDNAMPTLFVGNYVDRSDPDGPFGSCDEHQLFRPTEDGKFDEQSLTPGYCALSALFSDWSKTGNRDLRISNDRHYYIHDGSEQMWRPAENRFLDEGDNWKPISIWGMGIASRDITGDQYSDVVLTSMGDQLMQIGSAAGFEAAPFSIGTYAHRPFVGDDGRPSTGWHAEFGDVNNDGLDDLFIAKGNVDQMPGLAMKDPNNMLIQNDDGTFSEMADVAGVDSLTRSRGAALVDFDLDGRLDLVVTNRRAPLELYRNETAGTNNWVSILPIQSGFNRFAIGGWVELRTGKDRIQIRELTIGGGHAGGQLGPLHFGLGDADSAEIRITWPDGENSDWVQIDANQATRVLRTDTGLKLSQIY